MMEKSLRNQPFSDAMLREMAIHLPEGNTTSTPIRGSFDTAILTSHRFRCNERGSRYQPG